jgi:hypothetical protein
VHELGWARKPGAGDKELEKDAEGRRKSRGGRAVFMVVEKAQGLCACACACACAFPDWATAKPGADRRTEIIQYFRV